MGYELIEVTDESDWRDYHTIRREVLWQARGRTGYDDKHRDEYLPANHPLLLKLDGRPIGTARLDDFGGGMGAVRLVAIVADLQRRGHGRKLAELVEDYARSLGITRLFVNAAPEAVGYYEKLGWQRFTRDETELSGIASGAVQMTKSLVVNQFYEGTGSLFVEAYDAFYSSSGPYIAGDVAFYERLGRERGGTVLELACGTGRIAVPLARAGLHVTGIDRSEAMLSIARRKRAALPGSMRDRLTLVNQDMSMLNLGRSFGLVFVPFRSFQALLTIDLQRKTLEAIRCHLGPAGRLALHLFDPRLDLLIDPSATTPRLSGTHPETGRRYVGEILRTDFDRLNQIRRDLWRYAEIGRNGEVVAEDTREMVLRWTYRWELHHLLELCGLTVEAEYSDFNGSAPAYGKELILVARAK